MATRQRDTLAFKLRMLDKAIGRLKTAIVDSLTGTPKKKKRPQVEMGDLRRKMSGK